MFIPIFYIFIDGIVGETLYRGLLLPPLSFLLYGFGGWDSLSVRKHSLIPSFCQSTPCNIRGARIRGVEGQGPKEKLQYHKDTAVPRTGGNDKLAGTSEQLDNSHSELRQQK